MDSLVVGRDKADPKDQYFVLKPRGQGDHGANG
jgi:hypothetical protein